MSTRIKHKLKQFIKDSGGTPSGDVISNLIDDIPTSGGSSGGAAFVVTITEQYDESTDSTTYSADKTTQEIVEAYFSNKIVVYRLMDHYPTDFYACGLYQDPNTGYTTSLAMGISFNGGSMNFGGQGVRIVFEDSGISYIDIGSA